MDSPNIKPPRRVAVYIDGFNLYKGMAKPLNCKWVNLEMLFESICKELSSSGRIHELELVHFFTALISGPRVRNQNRYLDALRYLPKCKITEGKFAERTGTCEIAACNAVCSRNFRYFVEKKTDVAIGINMVRDALTNRFDVAVLVSGDSDLIPAAEAVKEANKQLIVLVPALDAKLESNHARHKVSEFRQVATKVTLLPVNMFLKCQFEDPFQPEEDVRIEMPSDWRIAPLTAFENYAADSSQ